MKTWDGGLRRHKIPGNGEERHDFNSDIKSGSGQDLHDGEPDVRAGEPDAHGA